MRQIRRFSSSGPEQKSNLDFLSAYTKRKTDLIVGWAVEHFPYHLTLLKLAVHRFLGWVGSVFFVPTQTQKWCTSSYRWTDNSSRSCGPTYTGIFDRFFRNSSSLDFWPSDQTKLTTDQPIKDYSVGWAVEQFSLQQLCPNCQVHRIIFVWVG